MLKKLFQWHRKLAWILLIPTVLWLVSGLTHPLMSNVFKASVATRVLPQEEPVLPTERISLPALMQQHGVTTLDQARLVEMDQHYYYQIHIRTPEYKHFKTSPQQASQPNPHVQARYFSIEDGDELENGDQLYAEYLARHFLADQQSYVGELELITEFNTHYQMINRLLPVYRVRFDRDDQIDVYVDTLQSRFASSTDTGRRVLNWIFRNLHTWSFIGGTHSLWRLIPVTLFISLMFIMGLVGLLMYGLLWKRLRKQALKKGGNTKRPLRRWHRRIGLLVAVSFIGFASSGVHTVLMKFTKHDVFAFQVPMAIHADSLQIDPLDYLKDGVSNFSLARVGEKVYVQLHRVNDKKKYLRYLDASNAVVWDKGDQQYAEHLARQMSGLHNTEVKSVTPRRHFGHDYPVIFKRLPVQKVSFKRDDWLGFYIETQTGSVAGRVSKPGFFQVIHFQWLHKYHFLDSWMSRGQRDLVISIIALLILSITLMGGVMLVKRKA